jgi:short-subunit dehydrogenase
MALEALTDAMRRELLPKGVHIAIVRPGAIKTEMFGAIAHLKNAVENSRFDSDFGQFAKGVAKRVPKHPSPPEDVAAVVYKAATDPKKKVLYKINNDFALAVLSRLPTKFLDKLLVANRNA